MKLTRGKPAESRQSNMGRALQTCVMLANEHSEYHDASSTVSQAPIMRWLLHERMAARTSVERPGEGDGQSLSHGGDRVLDVALGSDRGRLGVLDDGEGQGLRGAGVLRGERPLSRGSGIHRRRCRAWRGDGILASLVLRNGRGRVRS